MKPSPRILVSTLIVLSVFSWIGHGTAAAAPAAGITHSAHARAHTALHLRRRSATAALRLVEAARRLRAAPLRPQRHLTRQADGHLRSNVSCPAGGTWVGLPYLNRFYTGYTDTNGNCTYSVGSNTFSADINWVGSPVLMESDVIITSGTTVTSSSPIVNLKAVGQPFADLFVAGTLDLTAGASMQINCNCGIYVDGTLNVSGTSQQPVSMSLAPASPVANWQGVALEPSSSAMISYLDMEGGGSGQEDCNRCGGIGLDYADMILTAAKDIVTNSAFNTSADKGIEVPSGAAPTLTNDSFSGDAGYALQYDVPTDLSLDSGLSATGSHPELRMLGGSINGSATWPAGLGLPIHANAIDVGYNAHLTLGAGLTVSNMQGQLMLFPGSQLEVDAGVTFRFGCHCGLRINGAASVAMNGTATNPITFTSAQATPAPGDWAGMTIDGSNISLTNVQVLNAGSGINPCDVCIPYSVGILLNGGSPSLTNVTVQNSSGDGIEAISGGTPTLTNVTLQNNGAWPLHYDRPTDLTSISGLVTGGNGHEEVRMGGGGINGAMRWTNLGLPLHIDGDISPNYNTPLTIDAGTNISTIGNVFLAAGDHVSVDPGVTIHFAKTAYLQDPGATLDLLGTAQQPITLTGTTDAVGWWGGIIMFAGAGGTLDYVHLSDAGSGSYECCQGPFYAALSLEDVSPTVTHTVIGNSSTNDVEIGGFGGANPTFTGDSFLAVPSNYYGMLNDTQTTITAQCNFWGDPSGPYNASANPTGTGSPVGDRITFAPWAPSCGKPTAPQNLQLTPSGTSVTVTWNPPASDGGNPIDRYDVTVNPHGQTGATPTSVDPASACAGSGPVTCTTTAGSLTPGASYDVTVSAHNSAGSGPAVSGTVLVPKPNLPPVLTLPADQSVQYSDPLTFGIGAADQDGDPVTLVAGGLPAGLTFQDNGNGTGTVSGTETGPAGSYDVSFTASDGIVQVSKSLTITVNRENATVGSNDPAILTAQAGQPLTLHATIADANDGSPGDITLATPVTFTLTPYSASGPLDPAHAVTCTTPTPSGLGTTAAKTQASYATSCTLNSVAVGAYKETITIGGSYYQGSYDPWIAVFSPSAGFLTSEALLRHNGVRAHIFANARYTPGDADAKAGTIRLDGHLEYSEQRPGSSPLMFRSSSLTALSVVGGKTAFVLGYGSLNGAPGYRFLLTATDGSPGGHDQVGLQVLDASGHQVPSLTFAPIQIDAGQVKVHTH